MCDLEFSNLEYDFMQIHLSQLNIPYRIKWTLDNIHNVIMPTKYDYAQVQIIEEYFWQKTHYW